MFRQIWGAAEVRGLQLRLIPVRLQLPRRQGAPHAQRNRRHFGTVVRERGLPQALDEVEFRLKYKASPHHPLLPSGIKGEPRTKVYP